MNSSSTYAACLTPPGSGAIATIAVRGPAALGVIEQLFRTPGGFHPPLANSSLHLGKFGDEAQDEVVLSVRRTEPVPWVELHCHGGREVVRMVLETLARHTIQVCSWQELEQLTGDNPLRAQAAGMLAQAPTVRTAAILLDQYHGAFERAVEEICNTASGESALAELARWLPLGRHLVEPWRVVVAGPPNAGKSSLVNALAGFQRTIVSPIPGTTRDVVAVRLALDGWPVELADTAGLRGDAGSLEEQGIQLAANAISAADLCLWVIDGAADCPSPAPWGPGAHFTVINKIDLPSAWDHGQFPGALRVSAQTGAGLPALCEAVTSRLVPETPPPGAAVPFTTELCGHVKDAWRCWRDGNVAEARRILQTACARHDLRSPSSRGETAIP
ncbi:hypothetical protein AYO44_08690 [Planctomycetaceae bacterium SCGC AG-212-F19]|nr:hypothetical protein AYO44_08690 [Planctomycetaceae bacterium SCGC AG-212-F19]